MQVCCVYGMRLRGFSPGCQPMNGLVDCKEDHYGRYYNLLTYNRMLSYKEMMDYELDYVCGVVEDDADVMPAPWTGQMQAELQTVMTRLHYRVTDEI